MFRKSRMTVAVIGAGVSGSYHIKGQARLGSNIIIFEPDIQRAKVIANRFKRISIAPTMEAAIEAADLVYICTPDQHHREGALASIALGKPTIIEKPLSHNLNESVEMYRAAQASGVPVGIGTGFRLTPPIAELYRRVRKGDIGELVNIQTTYVNDMRQIVANDGWRKSQGGQGFIYVGGVHALDTNMWIAAQPVISVQAELSEKKTRPEYQWAEDFAIILKYQDGTLGRVWVNASVPVPRHGSDINVYGTRGALQAHNKYGELRSFIRGSSKEWVTTNIKMQYAMDLMAVLFNDFVSGRRNNFDPVPPISEGLEVMIVLDAIQKALRSGQAEKVPTLSQVLSKHKTNLADS